MTVDSLIQKIRANCFRLDGERVIRLDSLESIMREERRAENSADARDKGVTRAKSPQTLIECIQDILDTASDDESANGTFITKRAKDAMKIIQTSEIPVLERSYIYMGVDFNEKQWNIVCDLLNTPKR